MSLGRLQYYSVYCCSLCKHINDTLSKDVVEPVMANQDVGLK